MILSIEFGKNKLYAALLEDGRLPELSVIEAPGVEENRIGEPAECAEKIKLALEESGAKVKHCIFVLPSAMAVSKEMNAPKNLGDKDLASFVSTNLSSVVEINEDDYVTDWIMLDRSGQLDLLLGVALRRELMEKCLAVAKLAGLQCDKIELRINAVHKYLSEYDLLGESACMAIRVEDKNAEIGIFERNHMFARTVELSGGGSQEADSLLKNWAVSFNDTLMAAEEQTGKTNALIDQIENMCNFQLSRNRQKPIDRIYLYGQADQSMVDEAAQATGLAVRFFTEVEGELLYASAIAAGMGISADEETDLDLLAAFRRRTPKELQKRTIYKLIAGVLAIIVAVCLIFSAVLLWQNSRLNHKIEETQDYLTSPKMLAKMGEASQVQKQLVAQKQYNTVLQQFNIAFKKEFRYSSLYIAGVLGKAGEYGVNVEFYDYSMGELNMTCVSQNSSIAAEFSKSIEKEKLASEVSFVGYEKQDGEGGGGYVFQLKGTVKEMR